MLWHFSILVILGCFGGVMSGSGHSPAPTCSYIGKCPRTIMKNQPCNKWPPCKEVTIFVPCRKEAPCVETVSRWSRCSRSCDGGVRRRFITCIGFRCKSVRAENEICNTRPCNEDGNWSQWGAWVETACSASCCGGTKDRTRSRACDNPPPAGTGMDCPGDMTETDSNLPCNEQVCPLSCVGETIGTIFNDPCLDCSSVFYSCEGDSTPTMNNCPAGNVWSPMNQMCQATCDP